MSKIYLLSGLAQAQLTALREASIEYSSWDGNTVSIPEEVLEQTLRALNMNANKTSTEFEDVVQLTLRPVARSETLSPTVTRVLSAEQKRSRENYIAACSARAAEALKSARQSLEQQRREFPDRIQLFVTDKRDATFCRTVPNEEALAETFDAQFEELLQVPKVSNVRVTAQALLVNTETLYASARETGRRHEVGKFLIVIDLEGKNGGIRWFNATRRVNSIRPGMNAPNVYEDGTAYQDELLVTFYELIARLQFAPLVDMAIQFIEEVTNDDLATLINNWPLVEEGA
jgi:hypothetical protein